MNSQGERGGRRSPVLVRSFASRPHLMAAMAVGFGAYLLWRFTPNSLTAATGAVLAWDAACLAFIGLTLGMMRGAGPAAIRATAARQDAGGRLILALVVLGAAASLAVIASELPAAKAAHGLARDLRVALVGATVTASWFMVQTAFAVHYAHEYYSPGRSERTRGDAEGLKFPGGEPPDYWDFLHFSVVVGVACQTADVAFTSKRLRRAGTIHGLVAFAFNTVILALTINLLASLF